MSALAAAAALASVAVPKRVDGVKWIPVDCPGCGQPALRSKTERPEFGDELTYRLATEYRCGTVARQVVRVDLSQSLCAPRPVRDLIFSHVRFEHVSVGADE